MHLLSKSGPMWPKTRDCTCFAVLHFSGKSSVVLAICCAIAQIAIMQNLMFWSLSSPVWALKLWISSQCLHESCRSFSWIENGHLIYFIGIWDERVMARSLQHVQAEISAIVKLNFQSLPCLNSFQVRFLQVKKQHIWGSTTLGTH